MICSVNADDALRQLYSQHAEALHGFVWRFCPDRASADDIVQETFIRAWQHLPQLRADGRPVRPWLFRVARNLLTDADRAARARPVTVPASLGRGPGRRFRPGPGPGPAACLRCPPASVPRAPGPCWWRPSTGAGPQRRSPASLAYQAAPPDHGCTTRWARCASRPARPGHGRVLMNRPRRPGSSAVPTDAATAYPPLAARRGAVA